MGIKSDVEHNWIINNTLFENKIGLEVESSINDVITGNFVYSNIKYGIYLTQESGNNTLSSNILAYNGIYNALDNGIDNQWNALTTGNY